MFIPGGMLQKGTDLIQGRHGVAGSEGGEVQRALDDRCLVCAEETLSQAPPIGVNIHQSLQ